MKNEKRPSQPPKINSFHHYISGDSWSRRGHFFVIANTTLIWCAFQPLKSGHPTNQDTLWGPPIKGVWLEGLHCISSLLHQLLVYIAV